jgi:outer membrane protein assembly factor BamB
VKIDAPGILVRYGTSAIDLGIGLTKTMLRCLLVALVLCGGAAARAEHRFVIQSNNRLAVVAADGTIEWEMPWGGIHDVHVLENGNVLVQQGASKVVDIDRTTRRVVWTYDSATANGHGVLKVTPDKTIVWQIQQNDLKGITLAWVTTLEVLPNGNYVIGNCHAGPDNPVLIEVDPKTKRVVWQFEGFKQFGNLVSNTQLLNPTGKSLR